VVGVAWAGVLLAIAPQRIYLTTDMVSNHVHVWFIASRLWHGHGIPLGQIAALVQSTGPADSVRGRRLQPERRNNQIAGKQWEGTRVQVGNILRGAFDRGSCYLSGVIDSGWWRRVKGFIGPGSGHSVLRCGRPEERMIEDSVSGNCPAVVDSLVVLRQCPETGNLNRRIGNSLSLLAAQLAAAAIQRSRFPHPGLGLIAIPVPGSVRTTDDLAAIINASRRALRRSRRYTWRRFK
jgi:hypothetical protein